MKHRFGILHLVFIVLGVFVGQEGAYADGVVRSEFAFQLSQSIFDAPEFDISPYLEGQERFTLPESVFYDEAPVWVRGISGEVQYRLKMARPKIVLGAEQAVLSESLSANITIDNVFVDSIVERVVDGVLLRIRIQGSCSNIPVRLVPGKARLLATLKASVGSDGLPQVSIPWMDFQSEDDAWIIGEFSCTGFQGFKEKVQTGLKKHLSRGETVIPGVKAMIDQRLANLLAEFQAWFMAPRELSTGVDNMRVTLYPTSIGQISSTGFQLRGIIDFVFASQDVNEIYHLPPLRTVGTLPNYTAVMPEELIGALNGMAYKTGNLYMRLRGQEMAGFRSFMNNSFAKLFVWPQMNRYSASADFLFDALAEDLPRLTAIRDDGKGSLTGQISGQLSVLTWAPKTGGHEKMITFRTPISGTYKLSISRANSELKFVFTSLGMNLTAKWDPDYVKLRSPDLSLDTGTIASTIADQLRTEGFSIRLGELPLTSKLKLRPAALEKAEGGNIALRFE